MIEAVRENAHKLLDEGFDGIVGLRRKWGQVGPYLFTRTEEIRDLELEPKYSLATIIYQLQAKWPDKRWAAVVRGCDERALKKLEERGIFKKDNLSLIEVVCSEEQAEKCNCEKPVYHTIDCTGCWKCIEKCEKHAIERINVCPIVLPSEYNLGLTNRKAIYIPFAQAVPLKYVRDREHCLKIKEKLDCKGCSNICEAKAVLNEDEPKEETVEVGSIVLAEGSELYNPKLESEFGYKKFPNVISSLEFERILSASGPYQGHLLRPSDRTPPQKIAFIQCVGSRDQSCDRPYCSSVCCTYAIKEALIAKEHSTGPLDVTIFFMDIRTYGKDFDRYYEKAKEKVRFVRSKVYEVEEVNGTGDLSIKFVTEDGKVTKEDFNLVVLSVGFQSSPELVNIAKKMGIQINPYGFCKTQNFLPVETTKPGIFICGSYGGPKDIPETVMQASGAAGSVSAMLAPARGTLTKVKEYPEEKDVSGEEPRIGVFVCNCGINIGGIVNVPEVRDYAKNLDNVIYVEDNLYTCSQDTQEKIKEKIAEHRLNRVVVASCSPRTHEPTFQETLKDAGLNRYLFEMTNIRDQCSWVHMSEPEKATKKAKDLVRMAVAKARLIGPLPQLALDLTHTALIIGGGVAGMTSALNLADQGFQVHLVEKSSELGGMAKRIHHTLEGGDVQAYLTDLIEKVSNHPLIKTYIQARIVDAAGFIGNFTTKLIEERKGDIQEIKHGAAIIATGGKEYKPSEYLYGTDSRVLTQLELEEEIIKGPHRIVKCSTLVMIQCVGSRNRERPYCSRVCCSQSIKNALRLKELNPKMNIYILYRDMRTYGFKEGYYQEARSKGIIFIRYEENNPPKVEAVERDGEDMLNITVTDPILGEKLIIDTDILALSVATVPSPEIQELAQLYKVPLNQDSFFLEAHVKLRPIDFATGGVFLAGLAHSPKFIDETIAQAKAAASRATTVLVKDKVMAEGIVSSVKEDECGGCGICEVLCPYTAIEVDKEAKVAKVNVALCKGCGTCAAACPSGAAQQRGFMREQILSMTRAFLEGAS